MTDASGEYIKAGLVALADAIKYLADKLATKS